jgi:quinol monooxygenase YgiN
MLIVAGHFDVDPADREAFIADRVEIVRASRAEKGCLDYAFSADPVEPGRVLLYERWEDKASLATHLEGLRSATQPGREIKILGVEMQQYEIGEIGPLGS